MPQIFIKDILASINEYREYKGYESENESNYNDYDNNNTRTLDVLF